MKLKSRPRGEGWEGRRRAITRGDRAGRSTDRGRRTDRKHVMARGSLPGGAEGGGVGQQQQRSTTAADT